MRVRVPYDREGKRLRFHGIPEAVNGIIITVGSDEAPYITPQFIRRTCTPNLRNRT